MRNGKYSYRHFTKGDMKMASKHMKRCSSLSVIMQMQIQTLATMKYMPKWLKWKGEKNSKILLESFGTTTIIIWYWQHILIGTISLEKYLEVPAKHRNNVHWLSLIQVILISIEACQNRLVKSKSCTIFL